MSLDRTEISIESLEGGPQSATMTVRVINYNDYGGDVLIEYSEKTEQYGINSIIKVDPNGSNTQTVDFVFDNQEQTEKELCVEMLEFYEY